MLHVSHPQALATPTRLTPENQARTAAVDWAYGRPTRASERATAEAARVGLTLDDTYTAKAFAAALDRVAAGSERHVMFWHTLSSANMAQLLIGAPGEHELAFELRRLAYG